METEPYLNTVSWFKELSKVDDPQTCLKYCVPAINSIRLRLKSDETPVDEVPQLNFAAACIAYYKFSLTDDFLKYSGIKAGEIDISISAEQRNDSLKNLMEVALADAAPYLKCGIKFKSIGANV